MLGMDDGHVTDASPTPPDPDPDQPVWDLAATAFAEWTSGRAKVDPLVQLMTPVLWHVVRACGLHEDDARDVVQSTWLALVRNQDHIADPQAIASWLTITARREAWRTSRRTRAQGSTDPEILQDVDLDRSELASRQQDPADVAVTDDDNQRLWLAVAKLDQRCQKLLRIVAFEQRPDYRSIAAELDMKVGSIGPTRSRCLNKLRAHLGETMEDEES